MRKNLIQLIITISIAIVAIVPMKVQDTSIWMKNVDNDTKVTDLIIPGSHDSGALHSIGDVAGKCQSLSIQEQLKIGIRFFDIRLMLEKDDFNIMHSFVDQKTKFDGVLKDMVQFIEKYPSEFLLISIKKENDSVKNTESFESRLYKELSQYSDIISFDNKLPDTIEEARGKIYILSRFDHADYGIPAYDGWLDSTSFYMNDMYIQDNYRINDIEEKKNDILNTFDIDNKLILNYTSCYFDSGFPPSYAATPAKEINPWLIELLKNDDTYKGIIISDFVTSELVEAMIERNLR